MERIFKIKVKFVGEKSKTYPLGLKKDYQNEKTINVAITCCYLVSTLLDTTYVCACSKISMVWLLNTAHVSVKCLVNIIEQNLVAE